MPNDKKCGVITGDDEWAQRPLSSPLWGGLERGLSFRLVSAFSKDPYGSRHLPHKGETDRSTLYALLFSRSRISVSSATSAGGAAGAEGLASSLARRLLMPLTMRKMIQARIRNWMTTVMKLP